MTWVLLEIVAFLIAAFVLGLLTGFGVWRWRRQRIAPEEWNALTEATRRAEADLLDLEVEQKRLLDSRETLSGRLSAIEFELDVVRIDLKSARKQGSQYRAQRDAATARIESLTAELTNTVEQLADNEIQLDHSRRTVDEMLALEIEVNRLQDIIDLRDTRLTELDRALADADSRNDEIEAHLTTLKATLSAVRADLARERVDTKSLGEQLRLSEELVAKREAMVASTRFEREAAETQLAELVEGLRMAKDQLAAPPEPETDDIAIELETAREHILKLEAELAESETALKDLAAARDRIAELEGLVADAEVDRRAAPTDDHIRDRSHALASELGQLRISLVEHKRKIDALEQVVAVRQTEGRV